jgi:hypothetical protein
VLDEQPVDRESVFVGQRAERGDDIRGFHGTDDITTIIETSMSHLSDRSGSERRRHRGAPGMRPLPDRTC